MCSHHQQNCVTEVFIVRRPSAQRRTERCLRRRYLRKGQRTFPAFCRTKSRYPSFHWHQSVISRITSNVVRKSHGIRTTSTLILRTAGMSLDMLGSLPKNRRRLRKKYAPPIRLMIRKNVPAIRRAGRASGLIATNIGFLSLVTG